MTTTRSGMTAVALSLLMCLASSRALAQPPSSPVSQVRVVGSSPAVLGFPATATFDAFGLVPGSMTIRTSGTGHWPAVAIESGGAPVQSGTLWVFLNIGGQWYATGAERLRPTQVNGGKPEGSPTDLIGAGWLYDVNRWGPMANYNPAAGEIVGVMVAAGSTRSDNNTPVKERTNILAIHWPGAAGANPATVVWSEGETPLPDPPVPPTPPVPPPVVPPVSPPTVELPPTIDLAAVMKKVDALALQLKQHDEEPSYWKKIFGNRVVQMLMTVAATAIATWQTQDSR